MQGICWLTTANAFPPCVFVSVCASVRVRWWCCRDWMFIHSIISPAKARGHSRSRGQGLKEETVCGEDWPVKKEHPNVMYLLWLSRCIWARRDAIEWVKERERRKWCFFTHLSLSEWRKVFLSQIHLLAVWAEAKTHWPICAPLTIEPAMQSKMCVSSLSLSTELHWVGFCLLNYSGEERRLTTRDSSRRKKKARSNSSILALESTRITCIALGFCGWSERAERAGKKTNRTVESSDEWIKETFTLSLSLLVSR